MTTCPKLGWQPNSFPGSTSRLAINQGRESGKEATIWHSNPQNMGNYKHWTRDLRTRDPRTQGPRVLRAVLHLAVKIQAISANAMCLTRSYVLYVVTMHTEGIIYSRQRYSLTFLIVRVVYCQFCKARRAHTQNERVLRLFAFEFWPLGLRLSVNKLLQL